MLVFLILRSHASRFLQQWGEFCDAISPSLKGRVHFFFIRELENQSK